MRQRLGKYRIERRIAQGGFAFVYQALDTIEGVRVALKMPHQYNVTASMLDTFQREARLVAKLDHPNILPLKDASFIDGRFVITCKLGEKTLADRLRNRIAFDTALQYIDQMIDGVAYAHRNRIIHCDIKPENMAPEQAMGRPSARSDVFSIGLIAYKILTGHLPEWPFDWPPTGYATLRRKAHPDLIAVIRRSLEMRPSRRYRDANDLLRAFRAVKARSLKFAHRK